MSTATVLRLPKARSDALASIRPGYCFPLQLLSRAPRLQLLIEPGVVFSNLLNSAVPHEIGSAVAHIGGGKLVAPDDHGNGSGTSTGHAADPRHLANFVIGNFEGGF